MENFQITGKLLQTSHVFCSDMLGIIYLFIIYYFARICSELFIYLLFIILLGYARNYVFIIYF